MYYRANLPPVSQMALEVSSDSFLERDGENGPTKTGAFGTLHSILGETGFTTPCQSRLTIKSLREGQEPGNTSRAASDMSIKDVF
jgi:hypothetical protein